ncbi:hypothetical protein BT67DRAFT_433362 [Trichocladium antarcticum]|uniref:Uncharacterized protein n=1 Tax=Trichocladium antarcticum TaxID=1450529 RepID=A0AAN6ULZ7_9PEZI|nr:hypothetical protein BT67DRAFT_433362 [Trichocladium antarcticum]
MQRNDFVIPLFVANVLLMLDLYLFLLCTLARGEEVGMGGIAGVGVRVWLRNTFICLPPEPRYFRSEQPPFQHMESLNRLEYLASGTPGIVRVEHEHEDYNYCGECERTFANDNNLTMLPATRPTRPHPAPGNAAVPGSRQRGPPGYTQLLAPSNPATPSSRQRGPPGHTQLLAPSNPATPSSRQRGPRGYTQLPAPSNPATPSS